MMIMESSKLWVEYIKKENEGVALQILIVGASGYLGRHAYKYFKLHYDDVIGTYHTHQTDSSMISFDMNKDDINRIGLLQRDENRCAVICAAETRLDICKVNKEESFQTNVASTIELIEKLKNMNYYIVFCSTDAVYAGTKGNYKEVDAVDPVNEYARMKLQVEQYITENCPNACIFRLSKMIGDSNLPKDTLYEWKSLALEKKDIFCIKGNCFSPVDVEDVVKCIEIAFNKRIGGIYNICSDDTYNRADLCKAFLKALGLTSNVYEKNVEEFGFLSTRSMNVGMNNQKAKEILKYNFSNMEEVFMKYK